MCASLHQYLASYLFVCAFQCFSLAAAKSCYMLCHRGHDRVLVHASCCPKRQINHTVHILNSFHKNFNASMFMRLAEFKCEAALRIPHCKSFPCRLCKFQDFFRFLCADCIAATTQIFFQGLCDILTSCKLQFSNRVSA